MAIQAGFAIPATVISNDFDEVERFCQGRQAIVKHFTPHFLWKGDGTPMKAVLTSDVGDLDANSPASIEVAPAIFQEKIDKAYEIRLTIVGNRLYPARIFSREGHALLDWRPQLGQDACKLEAYKLDPNIEESALQLIRRLGLTYGWD